MTTILMISVVSLHLILLADTEGNNPEIQTARHGWDSAKTVATQVCVARRVIPVL